MTHPQMPDTLIESQHLYTSDEKTTLFSPGALAFSQGNIIAVGTPETVRQQLGPLPSTCTTLQLPNHTLLPGLINAHAHSAMALLRGYADDLPLMTWLQEHIWPAEQKWVSPEFVADGTRLALTEMLLSGTTTFTDMYFFPETVAEVAQAAGVRAHLACPIFDFPTAWGSGPDEYLAKTQSLLERYATDSTHSIRIGFGPHAPYTVSDQPLESIAELAATHNSFVQMHVHETAQEVNEALSKTGERPLNRLHRLGLLRDNFQAVHATCLTPEDIELLASTHSHVVHCPESNLKLASGFSPIAALLQAGVNVALGTDGAASNNDLDLFSEMKTASLLAKAVAQDTTVLPANQALALATRYAAKALGCEQQLGELRTGAAADVIAVDLSAPNTQPLHNLSSQLAYALNSQQVTHVWIAGRPVVRNRELLTLDQADILARTRAWHDALHAQTI
ncbi:MAG: TRZ/ATZ family hydrolase [Gammaproteobacteria bacterium]